MPSALDLTLYLPDDAATDRLGRAMAHVLCAGDTVALEGPIGAGKTHLARALIRARLAGQEDVPSPSFTLVQTYGPLDDPDAIWHADLYRLGHPDDTAELGLDDALGRRLCLIEWPDRMGSRLPADTLHLRLTPKGEGRSVLLRGGVPGRIAALSAMVSALDGTRDAC
ncbi:MAG: tRNA (adenosine(37)-N6)-threonylcarbamoyltransferase complex ATPase subunit type 1 TsaE [Paracoccaceae bacterium]|nr:MAG: tRNA (adenosine(37)-N6)-threonylcarbamoyltransferase complex ATPase subunit type 1 TsaE [Paracoccaceae bacterium]